MRTYLEVSEQHGGAVAGVREAVVTWVIPSHDIMDVDAPSIRPPHCHVVALVDVSIAVELIALSSEFKFLLP